MRSAKVMTMARKKGGGERRQRAKQRAQYDELDKYPVMPPHAFARIVRDKQTLNIIYQIIEPPMTKRDPILLSFSTIVPARRSLLTRGNFHRCTGLIISFDYHK